MGETKSLARRLGIPAGFGVRLRDRRAQVRACFEKEPALVLSVMVWPRDLVEDEDDAIYR